MRPLCNVPEDVVDVGDGSGFGVLSVQVYVGLESLESLSRVHVTLCVVPMLSVQE
jgi:hypothetical protein